MPLCGLIKKEFNWVLIKFFLGAAFGVYDVIADLVFFNQAQDFAFGYVWLFFTIVSIIILVPYLMMRIWAIFFYLRQPDDFDVSPPTEKMLRYESLLFLFDIIILVFEDIPQLLLLFVIPKSTDFTTFLAGVAIVISFIIIIYSFVYLVCCCTARGGLVRLKALMMFCSCCGCNWESKYKSARSGMQTSTSAGKSVVAAAAMSGMVSEEGLEGMRGMVNKMENFVAGGDDDNVNLDMNG
eukprot:TRINITY_DN2537_c0_g2_i1.p1 TRINITY_DN2537_c0_g2~~TRINITY_DN2537_c0_g2_i1.p1  ORF type:complete len:256 (+),score=55.29 TRINITY_DN2537_c0_g2_i1:52-768(+)